MRDVTSLEDLAQAAAAGDAKAADAIVRVLADDVYRLSLRMLWHPEDAEDATQEILVKVLTHLSTFRRESTLRTWVFRISANHLLSVKQSRLEKQQWSFDRLANDLSEGIGEPVPSGVTSADVVISNGVLNLTTDKSIAYGEVFRVLKPGGRFLYADIVVASELSEGIRKDIDLWTG